MNNELDTYTLLRRGPCGLVDPLLVDDFPGEIASTSLVPSWLKARAEQLPRLVDLRNLSVDALAGLVARVDTEIAEGEAPCLGMLLFVDAPADAIAPHLVSRMTVMSGKSKALLRYYDARVMCHLQWMLADAEQAWLFGRIDQFAAWTFGRWHVFQRPEAKPAAPNQAQLARVARIGTINEVLSSSAASDCLRDLAASARCVESALMSAEQWGLVDEHDQIAFAIQTLTLHPRLDRHPDIRRLLLERESDVSYRDACRLLGPEDWQRIRCELPSFT